MARPSKQKKAILLLEVALVVLITSIISVFLFRGYRIFIDAQKKSSGYLQLALESEKAFWELEAGITGNKNIRVNDSPFKGIKKVTLTVYSPQDIEHKGVCFDTVYFMPAEER